MKVLISPAQMEIFESYIASIITFLQRFRIGTVVDDLWQAVQPGPDGHDRLSGVLPSNYWGSLAD